MPEQNPSGEPAQADVELFRERFRKIQRYARGVVAQATPNDHYQALGLTVREYLMDRFLDTFHTQVRAGQKAVAYLSAEYLLGRQLDNALLNANLQETAHRALAELGLSLEDLRELETEPGLGNGGLGRLAACFIDSLATLQIPAVGYGIRYEYGIFRQSFEDGWQVEHSDNWLEHGCPWEFPHHEHAVEVGFGGTTEEYLDDNGRRHVRWLPERTVRGIPYNYMVPGYRNGTVNVLRLWRARASEDFNLSIFNTGDFATAVHDKTASENISKVLYPEDSTPQGKELRLQQQYFFVACSIADFIERVLPPDFDLTRLPERVIFQLNDTHPVIAVPELMRVLMDERGLDFERAWAITQQCFAYTCHTLLPEALEKWPLRLIEKLLPRHMQIIFDINQAYLDGLRRDFPDDERRIRRMSIIGEYPEREVRMAYLATVAASKVNGVAELHSDLLSKTVLQDFAALYPDKFTNVTNGVTPRRFIRVSNPGLSELITSRIGESWITSLDELRQLEPYADDSDFIQEFQAVKAANRSRLADLILGRAGIETDPSTMMYDVMVKRLHEYKRQLLKALHIVTLYQRLQDDPDVDLAPRVCVFGAKAAPGYQMAKLIIKLINSIGEVVNNDPITEGKLRVAFVPNYNVTAAETIMPGADLSEQISLAGKEASGTGNMKFALNGALTIGTLDGANVEIRDLVGEEHFFLFGLTEEEVTATKAAGYDPNVVVESNGPLRRVIDAIAEGTFSPAEPWLFEPIVESLLGRDEYLTLLDYQSYVDAQDRVEQAWRDQDAWSRSAVLNVARCGFFSSDRSMHDYLDRIWHARPVPPSGARVRD
jgi:starch phosphorylase